MRKIHLIIFLSITFASSIISSPSNNRPIPIFATYISDFDQELKAEILIKSIRLYAKSDKNANIFVFIDKRYSHSDTRLDLLGVEIHQMEVDYKLLTLPYTFKVYAAAQAEKLAEGKTDLLFWFDPETLVLDELQDLFLADGKEIALRPVFLTNKVAIKSDQEFDFFWTEIFKQTKIDLTSVFEVNTELEGTSIKAYFNCGVMSINPSTKLFHKWAELQTELLNNPNFVKGAIVDVPHQVFFHQAVFTAAVLANIRKDQIQWLSLRCAYPLNLHERMPIDKKIVNLNQVNSMIMEDRWNKKPEWFEPFAIDPKVKEQLKKLFIKH